MRVFDYYSGTHSSVAFRLRPLCSMHADVMTVTCSNGPDKDKQLKGEARMNRVLISALVALSLSGCAFTPQAVSIAPTINVPTSKIGNGRDISLNVVDERPKKTLGTVGVSGVGADISIDGDLVTSVQRALSDGLAKMDFKPSNGRSGGKAELRVEIRNLDYVIIRGFWAGTLRVDAGLKAICIRDGIRPYEKLHHGEFVESVQVVQGQDANTKYINTAISAAANSLLADRELGAC